ncbi:MAG: Trk system potassium transporter TrkA [Lachnospiraceae bacterium]|jgi:trk system potassium uptake protein TrkA|nr:Trk system potassium transporter TrkA [Lachnospiraceae bacterium]
MKILIVGCGKVGSTLAEELDREGHDIIVIDNKASAIDYITDTLDVIGIEGNGASYHILLEAGIETADLLIAVTNSDELNLLCCLFAKKASNCNTIARVRNPQYNAEINFIREEMGLSMTINPELEAANEMFQLIRLPSAIKIDTFADGRVELLKFQIPKNSVLDGMKIMSMNRELKSKILVCAVERGDQVFIPSGTFLLKASDKISFIAAPKIASEFFLHIGITSNHIKNALLIGGGTLAVYLTSKLLANGIKVKIMEQNLDRCNELSEMFPEALIINANASDNNILAEEGVQDMDAFASLTNLDEENILLSLYANKVSNAKIFTKITRLAYEDIIEEMPLGIIVNPKIITADRIIQHVRAMSNQKGSNVETLYKIVGNKVEALEFRVKSNSACVGVPLEKLELKPNLLVSCINRQGKIIIPNGQDTIQPGDTVIIVTTNTGLNDLSDILL